MTIWWLYLSVALLLLATLAARWPHIVLPAMILGAAILLSFRLASGR